MTLRNYMDTAAMAGLATGRPREKIPRLGQALAGCFGPHQRFPVAQPLAHLDFIDAAIARVSTEVAERVREVEPAIAHLDAIPGVGRYVAGAPVAEIGAGMTRFPGANHPASWAGMCPGNTESAGKRRGGETRQGSPRSRSLLIQAAHAAARKRGTYPAALYRRLAARRGKSRAAVAVGHAILAIAYHPLQRDADDKDLGPRYFEERDRDAEQRRLVHRLERLGFKASLEPSAA